MRYIKFIICLALFFSVFNGVKAQNAQVATDTQVSESDKQELSITVFESNIVVSLNKKVLPITDINSLDSYLKENYAMIEKIKALIDSKSDVTVERVNAVSAVLSKNKIQNIRAVRMKG